MTAGGHSGAPLWRETGRSLLARLVAELAYEEILVPLPAPPVAPRTPPPVGRGEPAPYRIECGPVTYTFTARRGTFGSWWPEPASLRRGAEPAWDPARFLLDARELLRWPGEVLTDVVREVTITHRADARLARTRPTAAQLADLPCLDLEAHQSGHPCMVANKGRLGFGAADTDRYAPGSGVPFRLRWLAAHPDLARLVTGPGLTPTGLRDCELDAPTRARFAQVLDAALVDAGQAGGNGAGGNGATDLAGRYVWLPVHPWQWENVIAPLYAGQLATGLLVDLGEGPDRYRPLQAVRTVANVDTPGRRDVKLSLMIRNTLVWRGMSAADAEAGPAVSAWLGSLARTDPVLRATGVIPLPEVAGATVAHPAFDGIPDAPYRFHELLGALWREPVGSFLAPGERARTFASLLSTGSDGRALVAELVGRSGTPPREWLARLMTALLPPLLHYLYVYGVAFTPHGENVICVFGADEVPRRIAVKDFGADIDLVEGEFPERSATDGGAAALCRHWSGPLLAHSVLSAVFAGHFRFFAVIAADHLGVPEAEFWSLVRATVDAYHRAHPEHVDRFTAIDLLTPSFGRVCLNREQFAGAGFHDRAGRDAQFDVLHGSVANPLVLVEPAR